MRSDDVLDLFWGGPEQDLFPKTATVACIGNSQYLEQTTPVSRSFGLQS